MELPDGVVVRVDVLPEGAELRAGAVVVVVRLGAVWRVAGAVEAGREGVTVLRPVGVWRTPLSVRRELLLSSWRGAVAVPWREEVVEA